MVKVPSKRRMFLLVASAVVALVSVQFTEAAHIVFVQTATSYSHRVPQWPLVLALIEKGHNVTYISPIKGTAELSHPKVHDLVVPEVWDFMKITLDHFDINYRIYGVQPPLHGTLLGLLYFSCRAMYLSPTFQGWVDQTESIDLVISDADNDCIYGLAKKFGAKHAIFTMVPMWGRNFEIYGIPRDNLVPAWDGFAQKAPMSFLGRTGQILSQLIYRGQQILYYNFLYKSLFASTMKMGSDELPDLYEMERNTALVMTNGDYMEDYAMSYPPLVVKVPGIHIKSKEQLASQTLNSEVVEFLKGDNYDGFIFISFGTVAKAPSLPPSFRDIFMKSIEAFPKTKFIWRWQGDKPTEAYPKNLLLTPWVNQQKLFTHPKIKAFVTQGGRPSIQEAFYHNVPTICFPILADQDFNCYQKEHLGTAVVLDVASFTQEQVIDAFKRALTDKTWKEKAESLGSLAMDRQVPSVEKALFWTEYVLRHTNEELNLMKPLSQQLYWFQRQNLDAWIIIAVMSLGMAYLGYYVGHWILRRLSSSKKVKPKDD